MTPGFTIQRARAGVGETLRLLVREGHGVEARDLRRAGGIDVENQVSAVG